jgi:hypothetical protein
MAEFDDKVFYTIISIAISAGIFFGVTYFLKKFFSGLKGIQKLTGLISVGIVAVEILYIGTSFDIFSLAIETIIAVGGAFWLLFCDYSFPQDIILFLFHHHTNKSKNYERNFHAEYCCN